VLDRLRGIFHADWSVVGVTIGSEIVMKHIGGVFAALVLAGWSCSIFAQALPPGSYQQSCRDIRLYGRTLSAVCRGLGGRARQTALDISHCVGDIGNNNGQLQCNGGRAVAPRPGPPAHTGPGYGGPGYAAPSYPPSGYPAPGYPPSGYPSPRYGEGGDYREHCEALGHEAHELYERLEHTPYGEDREHLEHRLREIDYQRRDCPHH
jgi:hypothetical protein